MLKFLKCIVELTIKKKRKDVVYFLKHLGEINMHGRVNRRSCNYYSYVCNFVLGWLGEGIPVTVGVTDHQACGIVYEWFAF